MPCGGVNFTAKSDLHVLAYNPGLLRLLSVVLHPTPYDDQIILRGGVSDTPFYAQA